MISMVWSPSSAAWTPGHPPGRWRRRSSALPRRSLPASGVAATLECIAAFQEGILLLELTDTPLHLGHPGPIHRLANLLGVSRVLFLLGNHLVVHRLRDHAEITRGLGISAPTIHPVLTTSAR